MLKKKKSKFWQYGKISLPIIIILIGIGMLFLLQSKFVPGSDDTGTIPTATNPYCRPEPTGPNTPTIQYYTYKVNCDADTGDCSGVDTFSPKVTYQRIKSNVLIDRHAFTGCGASPIAPPGTNPADYDDCGRVEIDIHFQPDEIQTIDGKRYHFYLPYGESGDRSYDFSSQPGGQYIFFDKLGLIFLVHLKQDATNGNRFPDRDNEYVDLPVKKPDGQTETRRFYVVDIYKDPTKDPLPNDVLQCQDDAPDGLEVIAIPTKTQIEPSQAKTPEGKHLQLEWFLWEGGNVSLKTRSWYTPQCKPAIYLYPEEKTNVHVEVSPKGFLTYTDPLYPKGGWDATAFPDGKIVANGKEYPYLYYESKIRDEFIQKPEKGYVVLYSDLPKLYDLLLPKLGLFGNQIKEFKEYWERSLPFSPYYFVGVMDSQNINEIEPLQISPKPATIMRVRLYFEALSSWKAVQPPEIVTPKRDGFTVVEWGGMVKMHEGTPFTCSQ